MSKVRTTRSTSAGVATDAAVREAYAAYNGRDLATLLALLHEDVDWPDGSRRMRGKRELADYWTRQWSQNATHDTPDVIAWLTEHICSVRIEQSVRANDGRVLSRGEFARILHFRGCLIARLDIVPLHAATA